MADDNLHSILNLSVIPGFTLGCVDAGTQDCRADSLSTQDSLY
jgi:hypothetical protein